MRSRMWGGLAVLAIGTVMAVSGAATATAANTDIPSEVTAKAVRVNPRAKVDGYFVTGAVTSPNRGCQPGRTIQIWRKVPGPDQLLYQTTAYPNSSGWQTPETDPFSAGRYYAVVERMPHSTNAGRYCGSAQSPVFEIPQVP